MKWKWKRKWEANVLCCAIGLGGKRWGGNGENGKIPTERGSIFAFWRAPVISSLLSFGVWGKMSTDWLTGRKCCEYIQIISTGRIHNSRVICCAPTNKAKWAINICNYVAAGWLWLIHLGRHQIRCRSTFYQREIRFTYRIWLLHCKDIT